MDSNLSNLGRICPHGFHTKGPGSHLVDRRIRALSQLFQLNIIPTRIRTNDIRKPRIVENDSRSVVESATASRSVRSVRAVNNGVRRTVEVERDTRNVFSHGHG